MDTSASYQRGFSPLVVVASVLGVAVLAMGSFSIWSFINYNDQKNNVDQKVAASVAEAKRQQSEEDEVKFAEREKQPTRQFVGPDDLGRVEFQYPKTWSGYISKSGTNGSAYEAYFQPGIVPQLGSGTPYALHVTIEDKSYESALNDFQARVKKGDVRSTAATINGENGNRLEGKIDNNIDGVMVLLKVRDKTLKVYTESRTFQPDFDNIIVPSLIFNR